MLELMNKHPKVNRFVWTFTILAFILAMFFLLPDVIKALAEYQQAVGK